MLRQSSYVIAAKEGSPNGDLSVFHHSHPQRLSVAHRRNLATRCAPRSKLAAYADRPSIRQHYHPRPKFGYFPVTSKLHFLWSLSYPSTSPLIDARSHYLIPPSFTLPTTGFNRPAAVLNPRLTPGLSPGNDAPQPIAGVTPRQFRISARKAKKSASPGKNSGAESVAYWSSRTRINLIASLAKN